jgi:hypothetical protein
MKRALRVVAGLLGSLALVVALIGACPCGPAATAAEAHACCTPETGLRAAARDCCATGHVTLQATASAAYTPVTSVSIDPIGEPALLQTFAAPLVPPPAPFRAPSILRI